MAEQHIVGMGGFPQDPVLDHVLALASGRRLLYVPTAGGENAAATLAIWRVHAFDAALREAWEAGVLLCGWSAGMVCWFEASVTDSFGPQLEDMRDGLGFLPGSACPHYDGEELAPPPAGAELGDPGCRAEAHPDRRQQHVEDDERDEE